MKPITNFRVFDTHVSLAPQTATILSHLKSVGEISGVEAIAMYKARSLTKRISEINDALYRAVPNGSQDSDGNTVQSEWKTDTTGQRYKRYFMGDEVRVAVNAIRATAETVQA